MLVAIGNAFDVTAIDQLIFLSKLRPKQLEVSGDGVLQFARPIAAGLACFALVIRNGPLITYEIGLTEKGRMLVDAWRVGNSEVLQRILTTEDMLTTEDILTTVGSFVAT